MKNLELSSIILLAIACYASAEVYRTPGPDGSVTAVDSKTGETVAQGNATDGGSAVAGKLYGVFSIIIGLVLSSIGLQEKWRVGAGFNVGLVAAMIIWIVFIDNIGEKSLANTDRNSDVIIFVATGVVFLVVTLVIVFARGVKVGQALLGPIGFTSLGLTAMLLIPSSATDELWPRALLVGLLAGVGLCSFFFKPTRRAGQALGVSWTGLFMLFLGVDILVESQDGFSLGLRKFFDSNLHHYVDLDKPYELTIPTIVMCALGIAFGPILAVVQHKLHPSPKHQWGVDEEKRCNRRWISKDKRYRPSLPATNGTIIYGGSTATPSMTSSMSSMKKPMMSQRPAAPTRVRTRSSAMTFNKVLESPLESEFDSVQKLGYASGSSSDESHGDSSNEKAGIEPVIEPVVVELKSDDKKEAEKENDSRDNKEESNDSGDEEFSTYSHSTYSPTKRDLSVLTKSKSQAMSQARLAGSQAQLAQAHSQFADSQPQLDKSESNYTHSKSQNQSLALSQSNVFPESQIFTSRNDSIEKIPMPPQRKIEDPILYDNYDTITRLENHLSMIIEDRATENDLMSSMPGSPFTGPAPRRASVVSPTKVIDSPSMLTESATFSPVQSQMNINGVTLTEALTDDSREVRLKESMDAVSLHPSLIDDDDLNVIYKYNNDDF